MEEKIKLGYLDEDYTNRGLFYNNFKDYLKFLCLTCLMI